MFKLDAIIFYNGMESQRYNFEKHTFIYGKNTVGKTALTKAIDYVLGSSENLDYQGLENIDRIEAIISNGNTQLWIMRTVDNNFSYKRDEKSKYINVTEKQYKSQIESILSDDINSEYIEVYHTVFGENLTFRSFTFLNFLEELGVGDLSFVFTKAKELKHSIRITKIMKFFFEYDNILKRHEKLRELKKLEDDLMELNKRYRDYDIHIKNIKNNFEQLQINFDDKDMDKNFFEFKKFKTKFERNKKTKTPDIVYLMQSSFQISEEIKLYNFMQNHTKNIVSRKSKTSKMLNTLSLIVDENPEYNKYLKSVRQLIEEIEKEKLILGISDYSKSIELLEEEKAKIDSEIEKAQIDSTRLDFTEGIKKIGVIEESFRYIQEGMDLEIDRRKDLEKDIEQIKRSIKKLEEENNMEEIDEINKNITRKYYNTNLYFSENDKDKKLSIRHLEEDKTLSDFKVEFDPLRLILMVSKKENEMIEKYTPGSLARQTHLQILTYLCMFEYLQKNFPGLIYMPVLIIDSANQSMTDENFRLIYPSVIKYAKDIGIQTIFLSKVDIDLSSNTIYKDVLRKDISNGLNKFCKKNID